MSDARGEMLLSIARAAISCALGMPKSADEDGEWLTEPGACFVTLTQHGRLRGCIGSLEAHRPLLTDLKSNAVAAALHDTRFMPLKPAELADTDIEVSLLSPITEMKFNSEADVLTQLRPGVDGIVFEFNGYRSTFLPQVWEQLPSPRQFLGQLKRKAGFPEDFWDKDVKISRYSVKKFSEKQHSKEH